MISEVIAKKKNNVINEDCTLFSVLPDRGSGVSCWSEGGGDDDSSCSVASEVCEDSVVCGMVVVEAVDVVVKGVVVVVEAVVLVVVVVVVVVEGGKGGGVACWSDKEQSISTQLLIDASKSRVDSNSMLFIIIYPLLTELTKSVTMLLK